MKKGCPHHHPRHWRRQVGRAEAVAPKCAVPDAPAVEPDEAALSHELPQRLPVDPGSPLAEKVSRPCHAAQAIQAIAQIRRGEPGSRSAASVVAGARAGAVPCGPAASLSAPWPPLQPRRAWTHRRSPLPAASQRPGPAAASAGSRLSGFFSFPRPGARRRLRVRVIPHIHFNQL